MGTRNPRGADSVAACELVAIESQTIRYIMSMSQKYLQLRTEITLSVAQQVAKQLMIQIEKIPPKTTMKQSGGYFRFEAPPRHNKAHQPLVCTKEGLEAKHGKNTGKMSEKTER